jgi:hypothetical protein
VDQKTSRNCPPFHIHITIAVANSIIIIDCLDRHVVGEKGGKEKGHRGMDGRGRENVMILSYLGELNCGMGKWIKLERKLLVHVARPVGDKLFMLMSFGAPPCGEEKERHHAIRI